ncbi:hypothetical protein ACV8KG_13590, partial [Staphylococcus aureus]
MTKKNKSILISKLLFFTENNKLIEENLRIADLFYEHDIALGILARSTTINILRSKIPTDYQEKINFLSRDDKNKKDVNSGLKMLFYGGLKMSFFSG